MVRCAVGLALALGCVLAGLASAEAQGAKRVALVIGNADYRIGRLANPVNDAEAVAEVLEKQLKLDKQYLPWLSRKTGKTYRLLTEAEWEYVARADTSTPFWWGSSISPSQANYNGNETLQVDSFAPNPWGPYNVHGNVWELVQDCWNGSYDDAPSDGSAWTTGDCSRRVLRGGSWYNYPRYLRAANRAESPTVVRDDISGFRLGRTL